MRSLILILLASILMVSTVQAEPTSHVQIMKDYCHARARLARVALTRLQRGAALDELLSAPLGKGYEPRLVADMTTIILKAFVATQTPAKYEQKVYRECISEKLGQGAGNES